MLATIILLHIGCAVYCMGIFYAVLHGEFPRVRDHRQDLGYSIVIGLLLGLPLGAVGAGVAFCLSGFNRHGWRLTP